MTSLGYITDYTEYAKTFYQVTVMNIISKMTLRHSTKILSVVYYA